MPYVKYVREYDVHRHQWFAYREVWFNGKVDMTFPCDRAHCSDREVLVDWRAFRRTISPRQ
jgi:hypothetical protein